METIGNVNVGRPAVKPTAPSHTPGVREGNRRHRFERNGDLQPVGRFMARATVRRSTGVNPEGRRPIDPRMPILTPA